MWPSGRLDVRRFGVGYWIGAIGSTVIGLVLSLMDMGIRIDPEIGSLIEFVTLPIQVTMFFAVIPSCKHIRKGFRTHDINALIGGVLGVLLCVWPFVLIAIVYMQLQGFLFY